MNGEKSSHSAYGANRQGSLARKSALHCTFCKRDKPPNSFSNTQIEKAGSPNHLLRCKQCTPPQQLSLTCMLCAKTKSLSGFAKAQRKNAERARCLRCMEQRENDDPNISEDSGENVEEDDDHTETWNDVLNHSIRN
ncbi:hypothetical protein BC937DRAFT_88028 [Endogone sp. FLAS-F59071]|nr:hypothetical protein BC937DRAFT_88028 [Endogone sp. FLAS-F59071]|eukprot:RUS19066.1 hypothetical protein BC937DRAFT_88028 [Endogone sp. FLAS-F59071]